MFGCTAWEGSEVDEVSVNKLLYYMIFPHLKWLMLSVYLSCKTSLFLCVLMLQVKSAATFKLSLLFSSPWHVCNAPVLMLFPCREFISAGYWGIRKSFASNASSLCNSSKAANLWSSDSPWALYYPCLLVLGNQATMTTGRARSATTRASAAALSTARKTAGWRGASPSSSRRSRGSDWWPLPRRRATPRKARGVQWPLGTL